MKIHPQFAKNHDSKYFKNKNKNKSRELSFAPNFILLVLNKHILYLTTATAFFSISYNKEFKISERINQMGKGRKAKTQKMKNRKNQAKKKAGIKRKI